MNNVKESYLGQIMTHNQKLELENILREDILDRYCNEEYYSQKLIDNFIREATIRPE